MNAFASICFHLVSIWYPFGIHLHHPFASKWIPMDPNGYQKDPNGYKWIQMEHSIGSNWIHSCTIRHATKPVSSRGTSCVTLPSTAAATAPGCGTLRTYSASRFLSCARWASVFATTSAGSSTPRSFRSIVAALHRNAQVRCYGTAPLVILVP